MVAIETALIDAAKGDFVATLAAIVVLFLMGILAAFVRWVMQTIPDQMQKDRTAITTQMQENNDATTARMQADTMAICAEIGKLIVEMKDTKCSTQDIIEKHDEQAKRILEVDQRIETTLNNRPCIAK